MIVPQSICKHTLGFFVLHELVPRNRYEYKIIPNDNKGKFETYKRSNNHA
jgi:hypothetical protein